MIIGRGARIQEFPVPGDDLPAGVVNFRGHALFAPAPRGRVQPIEINSLAIAPRAGLCADVDPELVLPRLRGRRIARRCRFRLCKHEQNRKNEPALDAMVFFHLARLYIFWHQ